MALLQKGYLGTQGPVFIDDATGGSGKVIILQGRMTGGVMKLFAVQPAYATTLTGFPYTATQCTLGPYTDNQFVINCPTYLQPTNAATFNSYANVGADWVTGDGIGTVNNTVATTNTTGTTNTTSTTGTTTTGTGTTTGTTTTSVSTTDTTTTPVVVSSPTVNEQISSFFATYWWAVLLIVAVLLWKPVIAPALGIRPKRRRY